MLYLTANTETSLPLLFSTANLPFVLAQMGNILVPDDQIRDVKGLRRYNPFSPARTWSSDVPNAGPIEHTEMWLCVRQELRC